MLGRGSRCKLVDRLKRHGYPCLTRINTFDDIARYILRKRSRTDALSHPRRRRKRMWVVTMGSDEAIRLAHSSVGLFPVPPPWIVFGPSTAPEFQSLITILDCDHEEDARRVHTEWIAEVALQLLGHPNPVEAIDQVAWVAGRSATAEHLVSLALSALGD